MSLSNEPAANEMYVVAKSTVRRRKEEAMSFSRRVLVARRRVDAEQRGAYIYLPWSRGPRGASRVTGVYGGGYP